MSVGMCMHACSISLCITIHLHIKAYYLDLEKNKTKQIEHLHRTISRQRHMMVVCYCWNRFDYWV